MALTGLFGVPNRKGFKRRLKFEICAFVYKILPRESSLVVLESQILQRYPYVQRYPYSDTSICSIVISLDQIDILIYQSYSKCLVCYSVFAITHKFVLPLLFILSTRELLSDAMHCVQI